MPLLIVAYILLLTIVFVVVLWSTRPSRTTRAIQVRLRDIRNQGDLELPVTEDTTPSQTVEPALSDRIGSYLQRYALTSKLQLFLMQAHSRQTVGSFVLLTMASATLLCALCAFTSTMLLQKLAAGLTGAAIPFLLLIRKRNGILRSFNRALPDAIDLMARALRAGHSMQQTLELVAEQSPEPLRHEFTQVRQEQKFGIPFRDALVQMSERVPSKDLRFVITAILIQKETGGDLIHILERTTDVIRDRLRIEGEVRTYTAQGRLTGWILSLLPVVMLAIISLVSPGYTAVLFHDPVGQKMLCAGAGMIAAGALVIRKIVDVKV